MNVQMSVFEQLREIALCTSAADQEANGRERLVRFLDAYPGTLAEQAIVDSLCARFGLYPYMSPAADDVGIWEAFALELHTPPELAEDGFTFHAQQQRVYERLMDGESVILSAPTSFGKSAIIDALIASEQWSNFVLIVPTIALIDETRRRLARYRAMYRIVTHPAEPLGTRNIIVMTQERFLELKELPEVDFFMIDEFYKLGTGKKLDSRRTLLNIAWNRLRATGAQYYLVGPNIDSLDERLPSELRSQLVRTDFRPVAVDVEDRSGVEDQRDDLLRMIEGGLEGPTLVFTGSPQKAADLGVDLLTAVRSSEAGLAAQVADWLGKNYDPQWNLVQTLGGGIATHTGPLPRSLQRIMVRLFNEGLVPVLVCTSTLIEGVNTAARNVVIYEKKIDGQLIDFFTFSNIRGRAGRMFRHFVGRVVTYMPPPEPLTTSVDIPIESQSDLASDADLVQLDEEVLGPSAHERLLPVLSQDVLSVSTIRKNRGISPTLQVEAATRLSSLSAASVRRLCWYGVPTTDQARGTLKFAFDYLLEPSQRKGMNFEMLWGRLQNARNNAEDFSAQVDQQMRYARRGQSRSDIIIEVLRFQRNWMGFTIPSMLRALQSIQGEVLAEKSGMVRANYEFLLRDIESLYLPNGIAELEDYGLPLPLGLRLVQFGLRGQDLPELLENLLRVASNPAVVSQLSTVEHWILADVVSGITG